MSATSSRLGLPLIAPSQAQKHVTHNEALQRLDAIVQLVIEQRDAVTPPAMPGEGGIWALGPAPTGDWAGQGGMLAQWADPAWHFLAPQEGWRAWDRSADQGLVYLAGEWQEPVPSLQSLDGIGIGTGSDAVNRLSVAAPATLFSHEGGGHQLKLNKAAESETATQLYQSDWTGHAETGLAGDNDYRVKVSADGNTWTDALVVAAQTGHVTGEAVQADAADITPGRLARADFVYGPGNLLGPVGWSGGAPTGAVIESGDNANGRYVRFADGTQITTAIAHMVIQMSGSPFINVGSDFPAAFSGIPHVHLTLDQQDYFDNVEQKGGPARDQLSMLFANNTTSMRVVPRLFRIAGAPDFNMTHSAKCHVVAVGRWF